MTTPLQIKSKGNSMLPVIPPGALLSIEPGSFTEQQPRPGEIVAFKRGDGLVCHRFYGIIRIGGQRYGIERGDHNRIIGLFRLEDYMGRLQAVGGQAAERLFRKVSTPGFMTLIFGLIRERWHRRVRKKGC